MSSIVLVAIDMDGTLLNSKGELPPKNMEAIKRCSSQGVQIVLATTRSPHRVADFSRQLGINSPMICTNGAQVWASPDGPVWADRTISKGVALGIGEFADRHGWELSTTIKTTTYWKQREGQAIGLAKAGLMIVERNVDAMIDDPLRILAHEADTILEIQRLCSERYSDQCSVEIFYEPDGTLHSLAILAPQTNKRTALELVLEHLHISPNKVMAIGDNLNDLPMLTYVGFPVAVGNAVEAVKQITQVVAPDNDHDGVAWALKTYILS